MSDSERIAQLEARVAALEARVAVAVGAAGTVTLAGYRCLCGRWVGPGEAHSCTTVTQEGGNG